jgi:hypothetical protein
VFAGLLPLCAFTQFTHRASSQSTHHLVAEEHSSTLEHGSQRAFSDISEIIKKKKIDRYFKYKYRKGKTDT